MLAVIRHFHYGMRASVRLVDGERSDRFNMEHRDTTPESYFGYILDIRLDPNKALKARKELKANIPGLTRFFTGRC